MNIETAFIEAIDPLGTYKRRARLAALVAIVRLGLSYWLVGYAIFSFVDIGRALAVAALRAAE